MKIELHIDKNIEQNASVYFDSSKKAKKKLEGAKKALLAAKKRLEDIMKKESREKEIAFQKENEKQRKKEWYEKFHWFISSDGFLVIGGKDATSNEVVIKKHMEKTDVVFHTTAPGSPFFIIKNPDGKDIPQETRDETAIATVTFSKAWSLNMKSAEVFEASPNQISKEAESGEYVQKGAFMIRGKRKLYNPIINLGIGLLNLSNQDSSPDKIIMSGPESAVRKNCDKFVFLKQGDTKKGAIVKILMKEFSMRTNDDILSVLPSGNFSLKRENSGNKTSRRKNNGKKKR